MVPAKLPEAAALMARGADLKIMTDSVEVARAIALDASQTGASYKLLIEVDCGDNRGGLQPESPELLQIAELITNSTTHLQGVLTHAGHSYGVNNSAAIANIAEQERDAVVSAATRLRDKGYPVETVSVGSTPTALYAEDLSGVTELRAGVYTVFDMDQQARGVCKTGEIALSVLSSVIGHNKAAGKILLDAGGLALSKDRSADRFRPEVGYGQLCRVDGSLGRTLTAGGLCSTGHAACPGAPAPHRRHGAAASGYRAERAHRGGSLVPVRLGRAGSVGHSHRGGGSHAAPRRVPIGDDCRGSLLLREIRR